MSWLLHLVRFITPLAFIVIARVNSVEFLAEPYVAVSRVLVICDGKDFEILACVGVTDGQTDRRTSRR